MVDESYRRINAEVYESLKVMWFEIFQRFEEAVKSGDTEAATKHRVMLVETFNNTADGSRDLMIRFKELEEK